MINSYTPAGGDQMTAARIRGSKGVMSNSEDGIGRLEGLLPVVEAWHTKMCLLEVCTQISCMSSEGLNHYAYPWFSGNVCIVLLQWLMGERCMNYATSFSNAMWWTTPRIVLLPVKISFSCGRGTCCCSCSENIWHGFCRWSTLSVIVSRWINGAKFTWEKECNDAGD